MKIKNLFMIKLSFLFFFGIMLFINYTNQAEISAIAQMNKPLIQPTNFTFAIWSVIYGWFLCWIIYSFFKTTARDQLYFTVRYLLPLNFTLNSCWVLAYSSKHILLSCFFIVGVLITCVLMFLNTRKYSKLGWFNIGIFSVYLGWISVATIVNIFYFINQLSPVPWTTFEQTILTILMLILLVVFGIFILVRYNDFLLPFTLCWALLGITFNKMSAPVSIAAAVGFALLFITTIIVILKAGINKKKQ